MIAELERTLGIIPQNKGPTQRTHTMGATTKNEHTTEIPPWNGRKPALIYFTGQIFALDSAVVKI